VTLRPGLLIYAGTAGTTVRHAHHSVQVFFARDEFVLADATGTRLACRAVVIPPDVPHEVVQGVQDALMVHLDPESVRGRELSHPYDTVEAWARAGAALGRPEDFLSLLPPERDLEVRHPAVASTLRSLPDRLDGPIRLPDLARAAGLSESRLAHLFREEVGLPVRPYVQWLRLQRAADLLSEGASATDAAHGAGFADGAHFSRICKRMFGISPSAFEQVRSSASRPAARGWGHGSDAAPRTHRL